MFIGAASVKKLNVPDAIAVGFNHQQHNRYQSPITGGWRDGDDIEQILVQAIEHAQHEIVLAVQELSVPTIADALIAARRRRVTVQVILETTTARPGKNKHQANSSPINASAGISWNSSLIKTESAQQLADALQRGVNAGLQIRLIAYPSFASRSFSEVLDLLGVALPDRNCKLESKDQPFKIGYFDHSPFDEKSQGRMGP